MHDISYWPIFISISLFTPTYTVHLFAPLQTVGNSHLTRHRTVNSDPPYWHGQIGDKLSLPPSRMRQISGCGFARGFPLERVQLHVTLFYLYGFFWYLARRRWTTASSRGMHRKPTRATIASIIRPVFPRLWAVLCLLVFAFTSVALHDCLHRDSSVFRASGFAL